MDRERERLTVSSAKKPGSEARIVLFGIAHVELGGVRVDLNDFEALILFDLVARGGADGLPRSVVRSRVWPELREDPETASVRLRQHVSKLGRKLKPLLIVTSETLRLPPTVATVDYLEFDEAYARAQKLDATEYQRVVELYRGPLVAQVDVEMRLANPDNIYRDDLWREVAVQRDLRLTRYLAARRALGERAERRGDWLDAEAHYLAVITDSPIDESAWDNLMRVLHAADRGHEAETVRVKLERDLAVLGRSPTRETEDLRTRLRGAGARPSESATEGLVPRGPGRGMIRRPISKPVGLDGAVQEVVTKLRQHRLVTITGEPGIGKTRVALEVSETLEDSLKDGLDYLEVGSVAEAGQVARTLASFLVRHDEANVLEALTRYYRNRVALLVLDNCETWTSESQTLVRSLLNACPKLKVLGTSRELLDIPEEQCCRLDPLPVPSDEHPDAETLSRFAATELFLLRAGASGFRLSPGDEPTIARICRRLSGLPLAIELAAGWADSCSPATLLADIEESMLDALQHPDPSNSDPQRSLKAALDTSWSRLLTPHRQVLCFVSLFPTGMREDTAKLVWPTDRSEDPPGSGGASSKRSILNTLVTRSLLRTTPDPDRVLRFNMLEPIREYCALQMPPEERAAADRQYVDYYRGLAADAAASAFTPNQRRMHAHLDLERDNLRAAVARAEPKVAAQLVVALRDYWTERDLRHEFLAWSSDVLTNPEFRGKWSDPAHMDAFINNCYAFWSAWPRRFRNDLLPGRGLEDRPALLRGLRNAIDVARALDSKKHIVGFTQLAGYVMFRMEDYVSSREFRLSFLDLARELKIGPGALPLYELGETEQALGNYEDALKCYRAALEPSRKEKTQQFEAKACLGVAEVLLAQDEAAGALDAANEARRALLACRGATGEQNLEKVAGVFLSLGRPGDADACFREALEIRLERGLEGLSTTTLVFDLANFALVEGNVLAAQRLVTAAEKAWSGEAGSFDCSHLRVYQPLRDRLDATLSAPKRSDLTRQQAVTALDAVGRLLLEDPRLPLSEAVAQAFSGL